MILNELTCPFSKYREEMRNMKNKAGEVKRKKLEELYSSKYNL